MDIAADLKFVARAAAGITRPVFFTAYGGSLKG
jgi:hypothetical protein